jgi:2-polyprenyl-3-methyl-5-hydroxy-6-metoxy-1,4-benzoquinol methylase
LKARAQELSLFYDRRFDCAAAHGGHSHYQLKLSGVSPHTLTLSEVERDSRVLDLGCANGYMGILLKQQKNCKVTGVDQFPVQQGVQLDGFIQHDLFAGPPPVKFEDYDYLLMLDILEHIPVPEVFIDRLRESMSFAPSTKLIVSTANVGFIITRLMLLFGQFNYGKRGILDITHSRLFTFASLRRLFQQGGFMVLEERGIPAPFNLAIGEGRLSRFLMWVNCQLIRLTRGLFSYQIYMVLQPNPSLELLLKTAEHHSAVRAQTGDGAKQLGRSPAEACAKAQW